MQMKNDISSNISCDMYLHEYHLSYFANISLREFFILRIYIKKYLEDTKLSTNRHIVLPIFLYSFYNRLERKEEKFT